MKVPTEGGRHQHSRGEPLHNNFRCSKYNDFSLIISKIVTESPAPNPGFIRVPYIIYVTSHNEVLKETKQWHLPAEFKSNSHPQAYTERVSKDAAVGKIVG